MDSFRRSSFLSWLSAFVCFIGSLQSLHAKNPLDHASIGIYAVHIPTGKVLIDENGQKSLIPSSCLKLVTTAAALNLLGCQPRIETHLAFDGAIEKGVLKGNLYLVGGGDPCLGSGRLGSLGWKEQIDTWALAIKNLGICQIEGKIIGDDSCFEKALAAPSWAWEDLGNYYGSGACGLSFHENSYSIFFRPSQKEGDKAEIVRTEPYIERLFLKNEVRTGPEGSGDKACIYGSEFSFIQHVRGTVPLGVKEFSIRGAIPDPTLVCIELLKKQLQARGVSVLGKENQRKERVIFHTTFSPKIAEIVHLTNQKSHNLYAEHLLKKMGQKIFSEGSTSSGVQAVKDFFLSKGVDFSGVSLADGSGLSRKNLITPKCLVDILIFMRKSEFFSSFYDSLPEVFDGIRAKSGSMSLVKGYAGYVNEIAFAILINQCSDLDVIKEKMNSFFYVISKNDFNDSFK